MHYLHTQMMNHLRLWKHLMNHVLFCNVKRLQQSGQPTQLVQGHSDLMFAYLQAICIHLTGWMTFVLQVDLKYQISEIRLKYVNQFLP